MNPKISIIIPVFNQEKYLARCLDSILAQTFEDFEVVCVDDHSSDLSMEILSEYVKKDSRVVKLENPGKGVCSARNFGIDNARGEYIGFVDSDDFIQPQMYEYLLKALTENNCDMVVCDYKEMESYNPESFEYSCRDVDINDYVGDAYSWGTKEMIMSGVWSKLVKADYLRKYARFGDFRVGQDMVLCAQLWVNTKSVKLVEAPLYCYFIDPNSSCHRTYEEKFLSLTRARYACYSIYKNYNRKVALYYLFKSFELLVRCKTDKLVTSKKFKKVLNKYFIKMLIPYILADGMGIKEKLMKVSLYLR